MNVVKGIAAIVLAVMMAAFSQATPVKKRWPLPIEIDAAAEPIKDLRNSSSAPDLGYAGAMLEMSTLVAEWFYISNRVESAKLIRDAGAWVVRPWSANDTWQRGMAWVKTKDREALQKKHPHVPFIDPHAYFSFWKENGMKAILCLENYSVFTDVEKAQRSSEIETVKKVICDYVQWIVDNGYKDCVAGFELGNESYWGHHPEIYAERWCAIVPEMKRIWPEMKIGMPLAEYRDGDPDIAAVRARATGLEWVTNDGRGEFSFSRLNQWSGRFIVAMSNQLHNISHVIYHFYGGDGAYGCSGNGFKRINRFAEIFPEIKDKRVWITEWRERSDEDNRCHQMFFSSIWKGHYLLLTLAQPNVDGISLHNLASLAGALSVSTGTWMFQFDPSQRNYIDPDYAGKPRMEIGPAAPVFRIYCDALKKHPIILDHGTTSNKGKTASIWTSANYYGMANAQIRAIARNNPIPRNGGDVEWVATLSAEKSSLSILMANSWNKVGRIPLELNGFAFAGSPVVESVTIPEEHLYSHLIPGERPLWVCKSETLEPLSGTNTTIVIAPHSVQSVTIPLKQKIQIPDLSRKLAAGFE